MVEIIIGNSKGKIECPYVILSKLRAVLRIRVPGAWYSPAYRNRTWDGFSYYITESGYFFLGLLPKVIENLKKLEIDYEITDTRQNLFPGKIVTKFNKVTLREYQLAAVKSVLYNRVEGLPFQRGILDEATNAGKTLIAASIFKTYPDDTKLIFIVNRQHLYLQLKKEVAELVGSNELGYIGADGFKMNRFMVCMAQTISKSRKYQDLLERFDICILDECHYCSSPTYKYILHHLENCSVRVGLSGTPLKHKDKNKNEKILSFFGPPLHTTSNKDLIDAGFSTPPIVTISKGNTLVKVNGDYKAEETNGIILSKERNGKVLSRVKLHISKGRYPLLLIAKFHNHTELLFKKVKKAFPYLKVNYIHVGVKNRIEILEQFKAGEIDILVSSKLIKEGQNLPLIKALVLACGGDSQIDLVQLVGRALRKHHTKKKVYIDDFYDQGFYLKRHSNNRLKEYKRQQFKIVKKYEA